MEYLQLFSILLLASYSLVSYSTIFTALHPACKP